MSKDYLSRILAEAVDALSDSESLRGIYHQHRDGMPLPSGKVLHEIIDLARCILFSGYYGKSSVNPKTIRYHIGVNLERMHKLLSDQILAGLCFAGTDESTCDNCAARFVKDRSRAEEIATEMISRMPRIRRKLSTDVIAAYNGDPAAESYGEIISCYPVIKALINYRIAHELHILGVPLIPRMLTEMAHSETGIDIHPAATIGSYFTIDHGTGLVIGATCIIGDRVKLYQGVTLGAKSFPLDASGNPIKGIPRHPILEDDVVVYSNATILGRVTIGKGSIIGANVWITEDMEAGSRKIKES